MDYEEEKMKKEKRHKLPDNMIYIRRAMEKHHAIIGRHLNEIQPETTEEANRYIQQLMTPGKKPPKLQRELTALERAQDMMYDAWNESNRSRRVELAHRALEISPDCADAYVLLAEETAGTLEEAKELYEKGVKAGERALGRDFMEEMTGNFWGLIETRPYMRARHGLADVLWTLGKRGEAISHYKEMLRLNPNDNQGIRYLLLNALLAEGMDDEAEALLKQYEDEWSAEWLYSGALFTFRRSGASPEADKKLKNAFEENIFVPMYLLGIKKMPRNMPDYFSPGSMDEAVSYVADAIEGWAKTPDAMAWLAEKSLEHMDKKISGDWKKDKLRKRYERGMRRG